MASPIPVEPLAPAPPTPPTVEPAPNAAQQPPVEPTQPQEAKGGLPDALIQIPAMQALLAGKPPALSFDQGFKNKDEANLITGSKDALMKAGIGFYRSLSGDLGVMFNQLHIHGSDLQAADKAGKLLTIAPPFDSINSQVAKSGDKNPILGVDKTSNGFASPQSVQSPPQANTGMAPAPELPASKPRQEPQKLLAARVKNLQPGSPTSGPVPGAGRFLNQVLKPVV